MSRTNRSNKKDEIFLYIFLRAFQDQLTVVVEDLRLCTVKNSTENERRFCFEVVSPSK